MPTTKNHIYMTTSLTLMHDLQVVITHGTLRHTDFVSRVDTASRAGFQAIGLNAGSISNRGGEYQRIRSSGTRDSDIKNTLSKFGIRIAELEALVIGDDNQAELFLRLARTFNVSVIQTIGMFELNKPSALLDVDFTVKWLQNLSRDLASTGTNIALEFIPTTPIPDIQTAQMLVERIARPNVGICVDIWHVVRGQGMAELNTVDWGSVFNIQISDGTLVPSEQNYILDCLTNRKMPGDGEFDLKTFMKYVELAPADTPVGIEVLSRWLDSLKPDERTLALSQGRMRTLSLLPPDPM